LGKARSPPKEWAKSTWQALAVQGQKVVKECKTLETPEENLAELSLQDKAFAPKQLPIMKELQ